MKINPEKEIVESLAKEILVAARTAPKAKGIDDLIFGLITDEEEKEKLAREMEKVAEKKGESFKFFKRDADNVRNSEAVILISVNFTKSLGLNCGACGFNCNTILKHPKSGLDFDGPICAMKLLDMGIAIGSAVAKAKDLCVDNRIMYTIGVAAKKLNLLPGQLIIGIPLSVKGKNIYFDRKS
ncbi:MAG: Ferredoxin domain protein [Thermodesulfobacterium sp.]|uniref:Ferredoxin domain protein n=1 Tax=Candidatus Thermodesulfobacterium syntrophicum TaxID=3060442 RepID=A0AAE3P679_9BACT|nr:Ferredoxin domain protein [Candidatus Thermodesulfobacterium syntrophicum]